MVRVVLYAFHFDWMLPIGVGRQIINLNYGFQPRGLLRTQLKLELIIQPGLDLLMD